MSLSRSDFDRARTDALHSPSSPKETLDALSAISRFEQLWLADERFKAWAEGRKGDAAAKISGLTDTLTSLVRMFAAKGAVRYEEMDDLHRHVSALRKRLKEIAPGVVIETMIGEGYEVTEGFDLLYRLLHAGKPPSTRIAGFTVKQSAILKTLAAHGSAHVDQIECLQRHISNIRAKLKEQGHAKQIKISTEAGEGLYLVNDKARAALQMLIAGELPSEAAPKKTRRKAKRKTKLLARSLKRGEHQTGGAALAA